MYSQAIRQIILSSKKEPDARQKLLAFLEKRRDSLHTAIILPNQNLDSLADFIERYTSHVPDFIEAIEQMAEEANITKEIGPILNIAHNYFVSPPDLIASSSKLIALLDEAYLAHRLVEEINDRFMAQTGIPLTPMDNTKANLIAHELIGEPFANQLDQAVLFSAELLLNEQKLDSPNIRRYIDTHKDYGWSDEIKRWPCLAEEISIHLSFAEKSVSPLH